MPISDKWQNYIKYLVSVTGSRVDELSTVLGFDIRESLGEIETRNAQYVTTMLKQEKSWLDSKGHAKSSLAILPVGFLVETSYNTTMECETEEVLLGWARKRFKGDPSSLKKIKAFALDKRSVVVDVPGYKIKRS